METASLAERKREEITNFLSKHKRLLEVKEIIMKLNMSLAIANKDIESNYPYPYEYKKKEGSTTEKDIDAMHASWLNDYSKCWYTRELPPIEGFYTYYGSC